MPTSKDRLNSLIQRLLARTNAGTAVWVRASPDDAPPEYSMQLPSGTVVLRSADGDGLWPYWLDVFNPEGTRVDGLMSDGSLVAQEFIQLWNEVQAHTSGASDVLRGLLDDLDDDRPLG